MENYTEKDVYENGDVFYYNSKDELHRTDGPAIEYISGSRAWYINGKSHRLYGPATVYIHGRKYWQLKDKMYTKSEHNILVLFFTLEPRRINLNPMEE